MEKYDVTVYDVNIFPVAVVVDALKLRQYASKHAKYINDGATIKPKKVLVLYQGSLANTLDV